MKEGGWPELFEDLDLGKNLNQCLVRWRGKFVERKEGGMGKRE